VELKKGSRVIGAKGERSSFWTNVQGKWTENGPELHKENKADREDPLEPSSDDLKAPKGVPIGNAFGEPLPETKKGAVCEKNDKLF